MSNKQHDDNLTNKTSAAVNVSPRQAEFLAFVESLNALRNKYAELEKPAPRLRLPPTFAP